MKTKLLFIFMFSFVFIQQGLAQIEYVSTDSGEIHSYSSMDELMQKEFPITYKQVTPSTSDSGLITFDGCPTGDVIITSQAEINALAGCTEIIGDLIIDGNNITDGNETITDLSPLNDLTNVTGDIFIGGLPEVTTLPTFESLTQINGSYTITTLALVEDLPNVPNQAVINGNLAFSGLPLVDELPAGLANVTTLNGAYLVSNLPLVTTLPNLPNQAVMNGNVLFGNLPLITSLPAGLNTLTSVNPGIDVEDNPGNNGSLTLFQLPLAVELPNFNNITSLGNLTLNGLPQSQLPSFSNLTNVDNGINIVGNTGVTALSVFSNLDSEDLNISIQSNTALETIDAFNNISYARQLLLANNPSLLEINGFDELEDVGRLAIAFNNNNPDFDGFENITQIGFLQVLATNLTSLDFFPNLAHIYGDISITNNQNLIDLPSLNGVSFLEVASYPFINKTVSISNNQLVEEIGNLDLTSTNHFTSITVSFMPNLSDLNFLSGITTDLESLQINGTSVTNLDFLSNVQKITNFMSISNNGLLTNIDGIANIDASDLQNFNLLNNFLLEECDVTSVCAFLGIASQDPSSAPNANILGNSPNGSCQDKTAAEEACGICPQGNIVLTTQAEVDDFFCDVVNGNLFITGDTIVNLDALNVLEQVNGNLAIELTNLTNLNGLDNLEIVTGNISVQSNNLLENMGALGNKLSGDIETLFISQNPALTSLDGLQGITQVTNFLNISTNNSLTNIAGLNGVTSIGSSIQNQQVFSINSNTSLVHLDGLEQLGSLNGNGFVVIGNTSLTSIDGLANINPSTITEIMIANNTNLSDCAITSVCAYISDEDSVQVINNNAIGCLNVSEIEDACEASSSTCPDGDVFLNSQAEVDAFLTQYPNCTEIDGNLVITGGDNVISNLDALINIESITGSLSILSTQVEDLDGLANVTGSLNNLGIANNSVLVDVSGLSGITQINRQFTVSSNAVLENLVGLNITNIGSDITDNDVEAQDVFNVSGNANLTSLDGLESLTTLNNRILFIGNNNSLTDISAIENINPSSVSYIYIEGNLALSECEIELLCNFDNLDDTDFAFIGNNALGCNSAEEVEIACLNLNVALFSSSDVSIYPNPFTNQLNIQLPEFAGNAKVSLINISGKILIQKEINQLGQLTHLDELAKGLYFVKITTEDGQTVTQKLIK